MKMTKSLREYFPTLIIGAAIAIGLALAIQAQIRQSQTAGASGKDMKAADYELAGPYNHDNLSVFLILGPDKLPGRNFLTLQEALDQKKVVVYETKDVNELAIQNLSNQDVYVQSGDIVKGGQQDRMMAVDLIVPGKSGKLPIAAFCVESGRWTKRGSEGAATFASSSDAVATKDLKLALGFHPERSVGNVSRPRQAQ